MPSLAGGVSGQSKFTTVAVQTTVCVTDKGPLSRFHGGPLMLNLGVLWGFVARSDCWMQKGLYLLEKSTQEIGWGD